VPSYDISVLIRVCHWRSVLSGEDIQSFQSWDLTIPVNTQGVMNWQCQRSVCST
jgi:hypothetical protein